jgi:acyl-CoA synthetase (NDP forming)
VAVFDECQQDLAGAAVSLEHFLNPRSIAVIGATEGVEKIGGRLIGNLLRHQFPGRLYPINLNRAELWGVRAYRDLAALPETPDLALIAIPAASVIGAIEECANAGIGNVMIASSGFADAGAAGAALQERAVAAAHVRGIRLAGPNTQGFFNVPEGIAATFSPAVAIDAGTRAKRRRIGVVSQSGGLGFSLFNRGRADGLDFSSIVSVGNQCDLELADYADLLLDDEDTKAVLLFIEAVKTPEKFIALARKAAQLEKPLIVAKAGRNKAARRAVASHTGSLSGSDEAYNAVFRRWGVIRAESVEEMLEAAALFTRHKLPRGNRVAVVSATGGTAAWLTDTLEAKGFELPEIDAARQKRLMEFIPPYGSPRNPVDITAQGLRGYAPALEVVADSTEHDAFVLCITLAQEVRIAREGDALARIIHGSDKPMLIYTYANASDKAKAMMAGWDLHYFTRMSGCAGALEAGLAYRQFLDTFRDEKPADERPSQVAERARRVLAAKGPLLCEYEAAEVLALYGIEIGGKLAASADEAAARAAELAYPVALKVQSPQIPHKSDAGGVRLGIADETTLRRAYGEIVGNARRFASAAEIRGVLVQKMAAPGIELIAGVANDVDFGPIVMCGAGGIHAEILRDTAAAPAPLTDTQADAMIGRMKAARLLAGARGEAAADRRGFAALLVRLARLAWDLRGEIAEIDLNPVIAGAGGLAVVDALIVRKDRK